MSPYTLLLAAFAFATAGVAAAERDPGEGAGAPLTGTFGMSPEQQAQFEAMQKQRAAAPPAPAPTEQEMGAPIYPGAVFKAEQSGTPVSMPGLGRWVFYTRDARDKVSRFYVEKTGKQPVSGGQNQLQDHFILRGTAKKPRLRVFVIDQGSGTEIHVDRFPG